MRFRNIPRRALRKLQMDGMKSLYGEAHSLLVTDVLFYRGLYWRFLRRRLDVVTRSNLRQHSNTVIYDKCTDSVRTKGQLGFRGAEDPVRYEPGDRFVCEIPNAKILGPIGLGITSEGNVITDTVSYPTISFTPSRRVGISLAQSMTENGIRPTLQAVNDHRDPDQRFDEVAVAIPPWNNYYHWSVECLLRFRLLEKHGEKTGEYPMVLIPTDPPSWMRESVNLLNYPGEVREWEGGIAMAETLIVPTFPDPIKTEVSWLRERMLQNRDDEAEASKRIYIERSDATVRRVANRESVKRVLSKYSVDSYQLGDLTVQEQINLFSRAELVVAPHGAGLVNILYATNASIVELFGDKIVATFDRLAEMAGHDYTYLKCEQQAVDIHVNTDRLDETLRNLIDE